MRTFIHRQNDISIAEIVDDTILIKTPQDILEILMSMSYEHGVAKFILHRTNISPDFFDLKTRFAGEILQKIANYRMQLAIIGQLDDIKSDSFRAFVTESHRGNLLLFTDSVESAKKTLFDRDL